MGYCTSLVVRSSKRRRGMHHSVMVVKRRSHWYTLAATVRTWGNPSFEMPDLFSIPANLHHVPETNSHSFETLQRQRTLSLSLVTCFLATYTSPAFLVLFQIAKMWCPMFAPGYAGHPGRDATCESSLKPWWFGRWWFAGPTLMDLFDFDG